MKPVTLDGWLYVLIALFTAAEASLSSDGAAKYINASTLWFSQQIVGWFGASLLALKMYRSTTFAEYRQAKNGSYHAPDKDDLPTVPETITQKQNEKTETTNPTPAAGSNSSSL